MAQRATLFIDGSNWYHALRGCGVVDTMRLSYQKISAKLLGPREWIETRYYGVTLDQKSDPTMYANNRRFLALIQGDDSRITVHLGRVEPRPLKSELATALQEFLDDHDELPAQVAKDLSALLRRHHSPVHYVEKGVDVRLAIDMVRMAKDDAYDCAYLLSADGDFVPAVEAVVELGKTVYAVSPNNSYALRQKCRAFIQLDGAWLSDCYRD